MIFHPLTATRYQGYNPGTIDNFVAMGFDVPTVVAAFRNAEIYNNDGQEIELGEEEVNDITSILFSES